MRITLRHWLLVVLAFLVTALAAALLGRLLRQPAFFPFAMWGVVQPAFLAAIIWLASSHYGDRLATRPDVPRTIFAAMVGGVVWTLAQWLLRPRLESLIARPGSGAGRLPFAVHLLGGLTFCFSALATSWRLARAGRDHDAS